jgi:Pectate lyase superfamily protein
MTNAAVINAKDYGVVANGVTDDTAAMQAAWNAAAAQGLPLFCPAGNCVLSAPINISTTGVITGNGGLSSNFYLKSANQSAFLVNGPAAIHIEKICIISQAGYQAGVTLTAPSGQYNAGSIIRDVIFKDLAEGVNAQNAANWVIDSCSFVADTATGAWTGVLVQNTAAVDTGDSCIMGCSFWSNAANSVGVMQYSSGGLKISDTKFNGWVYGYLLNLAAGANTSDLLISNCSFENQTAASIALTRQAGSGTFSNVSIVGDQFALTPYAVQQLDATPGWLSKVAVVGCVGASGKISLPAATNVQAGLI